MLITSDDLANLLECNNSNLLLVDCRSFQQYSKQHIPTSVNLDLFAFHWFDTSKAGIDMFNIQTRQLFSFIGADKSKQVVFYDDVSGMLAARGVWMLLYFSHPNVFMLDGGIKKWKDEQRPVEEAILHGFNPSLSSNFSDNTNPNLIADRNYILDNIDRLYIIDARSIGEYNGSIPRAARAGHIPNAVNIDWNQNIDNNSGTFKNCASLRQLYSKIPQDAEIVTYCQGAYRAANTFVALQNIGFKNVRVYLGSWGEWGNRSELPVATK